MADEKEFIGGMYPKKPLKDFIKCQISINRKQFIDWLKNATSEENDTWINIDIKESKNGEKWYAEKNNWKPKPKFEETCSGGGYKSDDEENIPF